MSKVTLTPPLAKLSIIGTRSGWLLPAIRMETDPTMARMKAAARVNLTPSCGR